MVSNIGTSTNWPLPVRSRVKQRRDDGLRGHHAAGLVGKDGRRVARLAGHRIHQAGDAGQALDDVVIGGRPL